MGALGDEDLLLDVGLPGVGLLDDLQLECGLDGSQLPPGLDDGLGLGVSGGAAGAHPAASDLLESLQLDAFALPGSSGSHGSPSGSGTDSPVPLLLPSDPDALVPTAAPGPSQRPRRGGSGASPATSESENNGTGAARGRSGSPASAATAQRAAASGGAAAAAAAGQQYATEDEKRLARMQRNRENAQLSRQRKKQQMEDLQARCTTLAQQNAQLVSAVQRLTAENATLRQQLALVCQAQKGVAAAAGAAAKPHAAAAPVAQPAAAAKPTAAAAAKPAAVSTPAKPISVGASAAAGCKPVQATTVHAKAGGAATAAAAAAVAARGLQWPLLPFAGLLPKVTLPVVQRPAAAAVQQQQQRPAAQPAAAAAAARPAPATAAERAPKRARTAAGASTAFLALFTLFMFSGLTPMPLTSSSGGTSSSGALPLAGSAQRTLQALPDPAALANVIRHSGRGLQALPAAAPDISGRQLVQHGPQPFVGPATSPLGDHSGGSVPSGPHLQQLLNSTLQALLLEPDNAALEAAALRRLQELGPVALLLDSDDARGGPGANPLAASAAFPQLAGQLFGSAGLEMPQMCQPVLEFDASSVPHAARTRRNLERHVMGATGFRGRSLAAASSTAAGGAPAAASPAGGRPSVSGVAGAPALRISEEDGEGLEGPEPGSVGGDALLPASSTAGPVLVSILLPANASGNGSSSGAKLAAADKVFVVLLHPQERFVTYSCSLPRPVVL